MIIPSLRILRKKSAGIIAKPKKFTIMKEEGIIDAPESMKGG
jgi:hypothetical protein